jgi:hypothetical protein
VFDPGERVPRGIIRGEKIDHVTRFRFAAVMQSERELVVSHTRKHHEVAKQHGDIWLF